MESLTLEQAYFIGELIGAAVVILSLFYVAAQVKQNTRAMRSATAYSATEMVSSWYKQMGHDSSSCKLWLKGLTDFNSLDGDDKVQMAMLFHSAMLNFQTAFYQSKEDTLDIDIRRSVTSSIAIVKDLPGFKQIWEIRKDLFMEEFREFVADITKNETVKATSMYNYLTDNNQKQ